MDWEKTNRLKKLKTKNTTNFLDASLMLLKSGTNPKKGTLLSSC